MPVLEGWRDERVKPPLLKSLFFGVGAQNHNCNTRHNRVSTISIKPNGVVEEGLSFAERCKGGAGAEFRRMNRILVLGRLGEVRTKGMMLWPHSRFLNTTLHKYRGDPVLGLSGTCLIMVLHNCLGLLHFGIRTGGGKLALGEG